MNRALSGKHRVVVHINYIIWKVCQKIDKQYTWFSGLNATGAQTALPL